MTAVKHSIISTLCVEIELSNNLSSFEETYYDTEISFKWQINKKTNKKELFLLDAEVLDEIERDLWFFSADVISQLREHLKKQLNDNLICCKWQEDFITLFINIDEIREAPNIEENKSNQLIATENTKTICDRKRSVVSISKQKKELLLLIEPLIGKTCYNEYIQNYYYGELIDEGREFRYKITYTPYKSEDEIVIRNYLSNQNRSIILKDDAILSGHYEFGANYLFIMNGLYNIIKFLEDRYSIDFDSLEHNNEQN